MEKSKIVEFVGLARRPGRRTTLKSEIRGALLRAYAWVLFRPWISLETRHRLFFLGIRLAGGLRIAGGSKGNTFENDLVKLIFNATAIANIADNAATSPLTNLQVSLHTGDPGEAGDQTTSEIAYTGYARVAVARTTGGWTVTANSASPVANIDFGQMTAGAGGTVTHFAVGTASSGAGKVLYKGTATPNQAIVNGSIPRIGTGTTVTED
jgi:hypothetical protein